LASLAVKLLYNPLDSEADKPKDYLVGITCDISDSGIGFYTNMTLHKGIGINILCEDLWNERRAGTVKWCKTLNLNFSLVGVALQ
jgi:hypothetical protein